MIFSLALSIFAPEKNILSSDPSGTSLPTNAVPRRDSKNHVQDTKPLLPWFEDGLRVIPRILNSEERFPNGGENGRQRS